MFQEEVSQVVYAAPGVLLIVTAAIVRPPQASRVEVLRRLATSAAAFLAAAVVYFASLVIRGQFREDIEYSVFAGKRWAPARPRIFHRGA